MKPRQAFTLLLLLGSIACLAVPSVAIGAPLAAQRGAEGDIAEPFKVGKFEIDGTPRVALMLRDALIVDIEAASRDLERNPAYPSVPPPVDMLDLIGRYEYPSRGAVIGASDAIVIPFGRDRTDWEVELAQ